MNAPLQTPATAAFAYNYNGRIFRSVQNSPNGQVDDADYGVWKANFGATIVATGNAFDNKTAVPEPRGAFLLALVVTLAGSGWRTRMLQ